MKEDLLNNLLSLLNGCDTEESAKVEFRRLIHQVAGTVGDSRGDRRAERVEFARCLMKEMREPRMIVRERLIVRFQVSRAQAYVDISDALQLSSPIAWPLDALPKQ